MFHSLSLCFVTLVLGAAACRSESLEPPRPPAPPPPVAQAAYDRVLKACVRDGGVDYVLLRRDHLKDLDAYLDSVAAQSWKDVDVLPRNDQLVLFLNLYNASVMRAVAGRIRAGYSVAENDFALFKEPLVRIGGETISLDHLEKDVLRKRFGEPRVHAALVCASKSCPPLEAQAFAADTVTSAIDGKMSRFLNDPQKNEVDAANKTVTLSPIFQWNAAEFGGENEVDDYASKYVGTDLKSYKVAFGAYDWTLNQAKLPPGHPWRAVIADDAKVELDRGEIVPLAKGEIVEELARAGRQTKVRLGDGRLGLVATTALEVWTP